MVSRRQQDKAFAKARQSLEQTDLELNPDIEPLLHDSEQETNSVQEQEQELVEAYKLGAGTDIVTIMGHEVRYHVLNMKQELQAHSLCKSVKDTDAYTMALQTAYFALAIDSIDGEMFYESIVENATEPSERWKAALKYYRPFIEAFFEKYAEFRNEQNEKFEFLMPYHYSGLVFNLHSTASN